MREFITGFISALILGAALLSMSGCTASKMRVSYTDPETGHGGSITVEDDVVSIEGRLPSGLEVEVDGARVSPAESAEQ